MESFIFLGLILLVGAITQNKSIVYATIFVLILKVLFNITESYKLKGIDIQNFMTQFRKEGINWGVLVITVAILIPIATGEISFSHLLNAFKSPIGWIAIISGITVSILSSKGIGLAKNRTWVGVGALTEVNSKFGWYVNYDGSIDSGKGKGNNNVFTTGLRFNF